MAAGLISVLVRPAVSTLEINVASIDGETCRFGHDAQVKNEGEENNKGFITNLGSIAGLKGGTPELPYGSHG